MLGFASLRSSNVRMGSAPALGWAPPQLSSAGAEGGVALVICVSGRMGTLATEPLGASCSFLTLPPVARLDWATGELERAGGLGMAT